MPDGRYMGIDNLSLDVLFGSGRTNSGTSLKTAIELRVRQEADRLAADAAELAAEEVRRSFSGLGKSAPTVPAIEMTQTAGDIDRDLQKAVDQYVAKNLAQAEVEVARNEASDDWLVTYTFRDGSGGILRVVARAEPSSSLRVDFSGEDADKEERNSRPMTTFLSTGAGDKPRQTIVGFSPAREITARLGERKFTLDYKTDLLIYQDVCQRLGIEMAESDPHVFSRQFHVMQERAQHARLAQEIRGLPASEKERLTQMGVTRGIEDIPVPNLTPSEMVMIRESGLELVYVPEVDLNRLTGVREKNFEQFKTELLSYYPFLKKNPQVIQGLFNGLTHVNPETALCIYVNGEHAHSKIGGWMAMEKPDLAFDYASHTAKGFSAIADRRTNVPSRLITARLNTIRESMRLAESDMNETQQPGHMGTVGFMTVIDALYRRERFGDTGLFEMTRSDLNYPLGGESYGGGLALISPDQVSRLQSNTAGVIQTSGFEFQVALGPSLGSTYNTESIQYRDRFFDHRANELIYYLVYRPRRGDDDMDFR